MYYDDCHIGHTVYVHNRVGHGRRKDFFRGGTRGFFLNFSREGPKAVIFNFSHSKPRKQPLLLKISKSRGPRPSPAPPSDAHWVDRNAATDGRVNEIEKG